MEFHFALRPQIRLILATDISMTNLDLLSDILNDLRCDEKTIFHAYQDSEGFWTIGTGILIDARKGGGITKAEDDILLTNRVQIAATALDAKLTWWRKCCPAWQRALLNMAYKLGADELLGFKDMLAAMQIGDGESAATFALANKWARQVGDGRSGRIAALLRAGP